MHWGLPPGNILQELYLIERLKKLSHASKKFLEIGSGNGYISNIFLSFGWNGMGIDLNERACEKNKIINLNYVISGKYNIVKGDFLEIEINDKFDVIIFYMVIEHISDDLLKLFMSKVIFLLKAGGTIILQVPSNMKFWSIEDEIAGHIKRYELSDILNLASSHNLKIKHLAALNYPLSNWLLNLSNFIVRKKEIGKIELSQKERTIYTGNREIMMKTQFPKIFNIILNPIVLYPFHIIQKLFKNKYDKSLVFYVELVK